MTLAPDEDLMLQVRDGAGETLGVLFDRYQTPLFNFYSKLTGDRTLSEDLVQEVYLRIMKYRKSYRPGTPFGAWVYQIARNAGIDHFRKFPRQTALEPEMLPPVLPTDSAQEQQEVELLQRALQQLPEEKREILLLCRFQELKYEEIAALLGCELNTVKTRIHRALQDLRKAFHQLARGTMLKKAEAAAAESIPPRGGHHEVLTHRGTLAGLPARAFERRAAPQRRSPPRTVRGLFRRSGHLEKTLASARRPARSCISRTF